MRALKSASAEYTIPKSGNLDLQPKGDKIYIMWFLSYYLIFNFEAEHRGCNFEGLAHTTKMSQFEWQIDFHGHEYNINTW